MGWFSCVLYTKSQYSLTPTLWSSIWIGFTESQQESVKLHAKSKQGEVKIARIFCNFFVLSCGASGRPQLLLRMICRWSLKEIRAFLWDPLLRCSAFMYKWYAKCRLLLGGREGVLNLFSLCRVILLSNGTLLITQVKPRNTGTYKCVGRGLKGSRVTLEASLLIAGTCAHTHTSAVELVKDNTCVSVIWEWDGHLWYLFIFPSIFPCSPLHFFWLYHLVPDLSDDDQICLLTSCPAVSTTYTVLDHLSTSSSYYFLRQPSCFSELV